MAWLDHLPNFLTRTRIALVPVMVAVAVLGRAEAFRWVFLVALLTDLVDGPIARGLHRQSEEGAHLDSLADALLWLGLLPSVVLLWPDLCMEERPWIFAGAVAAGLPAVLGFLKYRRLPGFHTHAAKLAMAMMGIAVLAWVWRLALWPLHLSIAILVYAGIEQAVMVALLSRPHNDVPHLGRAWAMRGA